jgi:hypothetical protein
MIRADLWASYMAEVELLFAVSSEGSFRAVTSKLEINILQSTVKFWLHVEQEHERRHHRMALETLITKVETPSSNSARFFQMCFCVIRYRYRSIIVRTSQLS